MGGSRRSSNLCCYPLIARLKRRLWDRDNDGTRAGEDIDPDVLLAKVDSMHKDMLEDMIENMDITDRVFWGKYYEQCFTGETAVQFLLENKYAVDAQDAVYLGVYLMNRGVLRHVCNEHEFQNARLFYRFVQK